ncbi:hypothetical protein RR48_15386 [Papilio machaon]|uniref:LRRNT domain-containing protein n=1 Tax=Papilio machaon TaxID=76193 RepID=A0A194QWA5_PAPMA|nr:hypothetical protein RR48_15386 [Papilio machaon]
MLCWSAFVTDGQCASAATAIGGTPPANTRCPLPAAEHGAHRSPSRLIRSLVAIRRGSKRTFALIPKMGLLLKILIFLSLVNYAFAEIPCPAKCQCIRNAVRCLHQDLQAVPKTPTDAHTL